jgi:signal transduction histidine kinase
MRLGIKQKTLLVLVSVVALTAVLHVLPAWYFTTRQNEQAAFALLDRELQAWQNDLSDCALDMKARALMTVGDETVLSQIVEQERLERGLRESARPSDVADLTRTLGYVKALSLSRLQIALRTGGFSSIAVRTRGILSHYVSSSEAGMSAPRSGSNHGPYLWVGTYADDEGQVAIASWPAWREIQRPSVGGTGTSEPSQPTLSVTVTGPDATVVEIAVPVQGVLEDVPVSRGNRVRTQLVAAVGIPRDAMRTSASDTGERRQTVAVVVFRKVLDRSALQTVARKTGNWPAFFSPDGHRGQQIVDLGLNPRELLDPAQRAHPGVANVYLGSVDTSQGPSYVGLRRWDFEGTPSLILELAASRRSTRQNIAQPVTAILATSAGILVVSLVLGTLAIGRFLDPIVALAAAVKERTIGGGAVDRAGAPSPSAFERLHPIDTHAPGEVGDLVHGFNTLLRELARELELRLDERVNERTRIARELHDTLLQSFHGVLYRFQAAKNMLPGHPAEAQQVLARGMDAAIQAITEGRDAVHALRASTVVAHDLPDAVGALGAELVRAHEDAGPAPRVAINVEGHSRELHPIVRHETYRVAAEALRNAFRHARARRIDVDIRYGDQELQLLVRDDGRGIDPRTLDTLPDGHWGLTGMRERAESIAGTLRVWSAVGTGTEIELTISSSRAYARLDKVSEAGRESVG